MVNINKNFNNLSDGYLFANIARLIQEAKQKNPKLSILNLGIGDVTIPLLPIISDAISQATKELTNAKTHRGYGPSCGFDFLKEAISSNDYINLNIDKDEIFISLGAKDDISNIQELFDSNNKIGVSDPTYPVYIDSNIMAGKTDITLLPCNEENDFQTQPPNTHLDIIYLCSPNNPTGVSLTKETLEKWVKYAKDNDSIIIYDAAYEAFITSSAPHSIYEIENSKDVAIEIKSFSKKAGFTSLRCGYTVIPKNIRINNQELNKLWVRRCDTKSGGASYPIQKGALSLYSEEGKKQTDQIIKTYQKQTSILKLGMEKKGFKIYGGIDSPYIWCKTLNNINSWDFFKMFLEKFNVVTMPGSGFGKQGDHFIRISGFTPLDIIYQMLDRINL